MVVPHVSLAGLLSISMCVRVERANYCVRVGRANYKMSTLKKKFFNAFFGHLMRRQDLEHLVTTGKRRGQPEVEGDNARHPDYLTTQDKPTEVEGDNARQPDYLTT